MKKLLLPLLCLLGLAACETNNEILTRPLRSELLSGVVLTNTIVEIEGRANADDGAEYGVVYGPNPQPTLANNKQTQGRVSRAYQLFTVRIAELTTGQRYYFRTYVKQNDEVTYSSQTELVVNLPNIWRALSRPQVPDDYQPMTEWLIDDRSNSLTAYFRTPDSEALEAISARIEIGESFSFWNQPTTPRPALFNYQRFYLRYADGNRELFQGLGYRYESRLPNPYQYSRIFFGEPDLRGRLPDYPGADAPVALFHFNNVAYFLEKGGNYQLWLYDNDKPSAGFQAKAPFPIKSGIDFQAFALNGKGYIVAEGSPVRVFEYDPARNQWTAKSNFAGASRTKGVAFVRGGQAFYGLGQSNERVAGLKDIWQYNPTTDRWTPTADYPGGGSVGVNVAVMNNQIYLGLGYRAALSAAGAYEYAARYDMWQLRL
jgi:hypothetical protein